MAVAADSHRDSLIVSHTVLLRYARQRTENPVPMICVYSFVPPFIAQFLKSFKGCIPFPANATDG